MKSSKIAEVFHEVLHACALSDGDKSFPSWEETSEEYKDGVQLKVEQQLMYDLTPQKTHQKWRTEKKAEGWTYGAEYDPDLKTDPFMVPFPELPLEAREKRYMFRAIVNNCK